MEPDRRRNGLTIDGRGDNALALTRGAAEHVANGWIKKLGAPIRQRLNRPAIELRDAGDQARDRGDWSEAADRYRAYLGLRPRDAGIWVQLGHALKEQRDYDGAHDAYGKALKLTPDDADLQLQLGHLAKLRGDLEEAAYRYVLSHRMDGNPHAERELSAAELRFHVLVADARLTREGVTAA